ncbi:helix-turn-helix domain-containing protein [Streptomyces hirsutus]|uniref:helix-turn-helix domain-containing protein n=1 Tax=Streptomyces hirsutus TaxID=35620 RepID=UPI003326C649
MPLRPAHLAATDALALPRLPPMSDRDQDIEILAPHHPLSVPHRQVGKPTCTDTDRVIPAGPLRHLPRKQPRPLPPPARPETISRRHRDLFTRSHAAPCAPKRRGRPPAVRSMRAPVLRPVREDSSWEHHRIHGEPAAPGIKVAACPVGKILQEYGIPPGPERQSTIRADFPRSRADAPPARALLEVRTPAGARL